MATEETIKMPADTQRTVLLQALREACVTMTAAIATVLCMAAIVPGPGPAVLAVVLCLSLSRSHLDRDRRGRIEAAFALPFVGLAAVGVGILLHRYPWLGAVVFTAGMFLSIWLRRYGPMAQRAGSLIALPFVALLVTPSMPATVDSAVPRWFLPIVIALLALAWVSALHALASRLRVLPPAPREVESASPAAKVESTLRPIASTRMAIQMAVALAASFVTGYVAFAEHWAWIVLTAFIVLSGSRGRLDVVYKSGLRLLGAAAGTVVAFSLGGHLQFQGRAVVAAIFGAIFLGVWLRPIGYAWWALFVTIALALLQGYSGDAATALLWPRLEEIAIGAAIGIAVAWFVLPISSTGALRKRMADALAALSEAVDPANPQRGPAAFLAALAQLQPMAPAFRAARWFGRRSTTPQPADWIDALLACRAPACRLIARGETPGAVRRAVGAARKAMREPAEILAALQELQRVLAAAEAPGAE